MKHLFDAPPVEEPHAESQQEIEIKIDFTQESLEQSDAEFGLDLLPVFEALHISIAGLNPDSKRDRKILGTKLREMAINHGENLTNFAVKFWKWRKANKK